MSQKSRSTDIKEQTLFEGLEQLIHANLEWLARIILKGVRLKKKDSPIDVDTGPKPNPAMPTGPYLESRKHQRGDLLVFVPRAINSLLIDDFTGRYGYSHVAVDCGEVDLPTGKPVMIESTVGQLVERRFLDEYGGRHFIRIPLKKAGVSPDAFCDCVKDKLGEPYDNLEALTWGQIDDPAKQVCSDLAAVCLPEHLRQDMAKASRVGLLRRRAISVHTRPSDHNLRMFISPNGFAEYFGAPQGEDVTQADQLVIPRPVKATPTKVVKKHFPKAILAIAGVGALWYLGKKLPATRERLQPRFPAQPGQRGWILHRRV